ncbi:Alkaline-phosphatase-like, core domain,Alkaline phosphatase-like, alpha/beta/alpha,Sulfatase, N- [Cinara cedri]|uniref:Alkaline-phosphatase-like, core domain,Alkaline phosphatase-like, alpha/beta/alpha,Sulfatase, N n=1 Tax=Cinara cedri TaxID=506608 RepID=A0A5E4NDL8_9HEMI|nr:Alkaline-phosphatase-like, core domain,Alkaline phosphatase-like, alpha/beta/alpha,Sulfatase, N- [Cinara cedri]
MCVLVLLILLVNRLALPSFDIANEFAKKICCRYLMIKAVPGRHTQYTSVTMSEFIGCFTFILIVISSFLLTNCSLQRESKNKQPHIVLIIADDLGWNDVSFHGSVQIPTPNIDALAYSGVILNRHYVQPTCTPSRAALLTGKYPIRYGLQGTPIIAGQPLSLSSKEKILPQYLQDLGYSTHLVGKWHLGAYKKQFTPTKRGFDSHFGYWNGFISYRNSTHSTTLMSGKDARRGFERVGNEMIDRYATDIFTEEAHKVIESCKHQEKPMFLMISHLAVHTGVPGPNLLEVSNNTYNDIRFNYIQNKERRLYAGMLTSLDDSVGSVIKSLDNNGMLENSIVLFISDNGAPADDPIWGYENSGSNWPLRGEKGAVLEGGVRGVAAIWSPWIKKKHRISENLFHITDWLPTLYTAAGGNFEDLGQIDGIDQWKSLTETSKHMRSIILINIDEIRGEEALIFNQWKAVKSNRTSDIAYYLKYSGDPGNLGPDYNMPNVAESLAGLHLSRINCLVSKEDCMDTLTTYTLFENVRSQAKVDTKCTERISDYNPNKHYECFDSYCLFDIQQDPCEYRNIAKTNQQALNMTIDMLEQFKKEMIKQVNPEIDPKANPSYFDGYWETWMEHSGSNYLIVNTYLTLFMSLLYFF